jgi:serine/threonine-protein kinase ATR
MIFQGETLGWPELVPFRLTHNMVSAMGIAGVEGPFTKSAELTLRVMRRNSETLLSVLKPMMFDATAKDRLEEKENRHKVEFMNTAVI